MEILSWEPPVTIKPLSAANASGWLYADELMVGIKAVLRIYKSAGVSS